MKKKYTYSAKASHKIPRNEGIRAYTQLRQQLEQDGIFKRSYHYYALVTISVVAALFFSLVFFVLSRSIAWQIFWTLMTAFWAVQVAGLMHDAGHRQIFTSTFWNDMYGYAVCTLLGVGFEQWRVKHNIHHAHTNDDDDPDVHLPILSFSKERYDAKKGIIKFLARYQVWLYYPLGTLVVFSVRLNNIKFLKNNFRRSLLVHALLYVIGLFCWFFLPFIVFPLSKAIIFSFFFNVLAGIYLFSVFAPNHKGMPYVDKEEEFSFLEKQIITSRNLPANWLIDFLYLGLNYQIEHHLFPNCPRNKLGKVKPYVERLCKRMGIEYTEVGVIETNKIILNELAQVVR